MKFEVVDKYANSNIQLPRRTTQLAAGYDMFVAEDTIIPPYHQQMQDLDIYYYNNYKNDTDPLTLDELAEMTKKAHARPTLVSTGVKIQLDRDKYLKLVARSSIPYKDWLVIANGTGTIDADYWNNPDNEGEIFFQLINLSPVPILLKKGDRIGQGIILPYYLVDDDNPNGVRKGGFGSTGSSTLSNNTLLGELNESAGT